MDDLPRIKSSDASLALNPSKAMKVFELRHGRWVWCSPMVQPVVAGPMCW